MQGAGPRCAPSAWPSLACPCCHACGRQRRSRHQTGAARQAAPPAARSRSRSRTSGRPCPRGRSHTAVALRRLQDPATASRGRVPQPRPPRSHITATAAHRRLSLPQLRSGQSRQRLLAPRPRTLLPSHRPVLGPPLKTTASPLSSSGRQQRGQQEGPHGRRTPRRVLPSRPFVTAARCEPRCHGWAAPGLGLTGHLVPRHGHPSPRQLGPCSQLEGI